MIKLKNGAMEVFGKKFTLGMSYTEAEKLFRKEIVSKSPQKKSMILKPVILYDMYAKEVVLWFHNEKLKNITVYPYRELSPKLPDNTILNALENEKLLKELFEDMPEAIIKGSGADKIYEIDGIYVYHGYDEVDYTYSYIEIEDQRNILNFRKKKIDSKEGKQSV